MKTTYKEACTSAKIQPTETNCTSKSEGGNKKQLCMDNEIYLMVDRNAGHVEGDYKTCLYDFSTFEMQKNICSPAKYKLDGQGSSPDHAQTSVEFQADGDLVDKNLIETVDLSMETAIICYTDIVKNNKDSGLISNMSLGSDKVHSDGLSNNLPLAAASVKGDDISNMAIPLLYSRTSRRNLNKEIEMVKKDKVEMRKQASGGRKRDKDIEIVGEDKVEMRKQASVGGRKRDKEIEIVREDKVKMRKQASGGGRKRDKEIEIVREDKVEMRKQAYGGGRKRDKEIKIVMEDKVKMRKEASGGGRKRDIEIEILREDKVEMRKQASGGGRKRDKDIEILGEDKVEMRKHASGGGRKRDIEIFGEDKVEMRKQASGGSRKRVLEPSAKAEGGNSLAASEANEVLQIVPVDSLDVPSAGASSITSLPLPAGCVYIEFRDCLPSVTFRIDSWRADVILEDPEGKEWRGIFHDDLGYHLLVAEWDKITAENGIQPEDQLVFRVADASLNKYKFHVAPKQLEN